MPSVPDSPRNLVEATTAAMQVHGAAHTGGTGSAGLVLLYAADYAALPAAYVLSGEEVIVGRDPAAGLHIAATAVSRHHARIRKEGDRFVLTDLGGRNGTLVNGRFVKEARLRHLDELRFGNSIFKFVERNAEQHAAHRIDGAASDPATGRMRPGLGVGRIVGGLQMRQIAEELRRVAKGDLAVLLLGETGTGKEVFAAQVHDWSGRKGAFQAVNCAAIPATLAEAELFGHRRGAFSGATHDRPGLVRAAHGGTLFLDEIGELPLEAQAKLLRVIQSREVTPVGAEQPERVDVRFVCATHRDLGQMQADERFRRDLFARLNEVSVTLPPLRARKEDIFALCTALAARHGWPDIEVTFAAMVGLLHHDWPYNVRELEALIKRWAAAAATPVLDENAWSDEIARRMKSYGAPVEEPGSAAAPDVPGAAPLARGAVPSEAELRELLTQERGNVASVARLLGRDRTQIRRWMKRFGIEPDGYR